MVGIPSISFIVVRISLPGIGTATNPLPPPANWVNRFSQICKKIPVLGNGRKKRYGHKESMNDCNTGLNGNLHSC